MTNHKWNVLNIMRFYTRIGKDFNAEIYMDFITPHEGANVKRSNLPEMSVIRTIIRRYVENGWARRVGKNVVITDKGIHAMYLYEKQVLEAKEVKKEKDYLAKGFARPNLRAPDGSFLPSPRKPKKKKQKTSD